MSSIADFENMMSLDNPIKSSTLSRWERKQQTSQDRYIPNRSGMEKALCQRSFSEDSSKTDHDDDIEMDTYSKILTTSDGNAGDNTRILSFKQKAPLPKDGYQSSLKVLYSQQTGKKNDVVKSSRHIPSAPIRVLDAPDIVDDYYLNLLSWGSNNCLAVALSQSLFLWDATSGSIKELMSLDGEESYISSVSWIQQGGSTVAIGTSDNVVQLWDAESGRHLRTLRGHGSRVGALSWNSHMLTSGSRDTSILNHDVRIQNHIIGTMNHHTQEVCGLSWSLDGSQLASGANDNTLKIFDVANCSMNANSKPMHVLNDHQAAVKALAWSPHERNILASGGGTADRCIKFWNTSSGALLNSVDTGSQVCALQWNPYEKEILSSHGYAENQLCLWKYPSMVRTKELRGHHARVLHMATSPDGTVCSAAADETLRFWNIFGSCDTKRREAGVTSASLSKSNSLKIRCISHFSVNEHSNFLVLCSR